jgi:CBS domain-containing protein
MTQQGLAMVRISSLDVADDRVPAARTVADVMKRDVGAVSPEMSVNRAGRVLLDQETLALPVVDRAGHVIGVFSEEDLVVRLGPRRRRPCLPHRQ